MSLDCYYFLERKEGNEWLLVKPDEKYDEYGDGTLFWHTRSYSSDFLERYTISGLSFSDYRKELREEYREDYEKLKNGGSHWDSWYPECKLMDLGAMVRDFESNIHEYDGIISNNDKLKVEREWEYSPKVISPDAYCRLPRRIRKNYVYHAWDSPWSEYGKIYPVVPIVLDTMKRDGLEMDEVRLTYYWD